ncbi:MAG: calcineurin-like phosphoesterase C-terminal domain-containing protein [Candidatus Cryptobacteroides sp.]
MGFDVEFEVPEVAYINPETDKTFTFKVLDSKAPVTTDQVLFRKGSELAKKCPVTAASAESFTISLPEGLEFAKFTDDVNKFLAAHKGEKIYALTLGDMTWDRYWYKRSYQFENYLKDVNAIKGLTIYHLIGNHDHDMKSAGDYDTILRFIDVIAPDGTRGGYMVFNMDGKDIKWQYKQTGGSADVQFTTYDRNNIYLSSSIWMKDAPEANKAALSGCGLRLRSPAAVFGCASRQLLKVKCRIFC